MRNLRIVVLALGIGSMAAFAPGQIVDIVGASTSVATGTGLAKGNSYLVSVPVVNLIQIEYWLTFTGPQTLTFYVYSSPVEFGSYTQVLSVSATVTGTGSAWYPSPSIFVPMSNGNHYIIAASWSGTMTYYYGVGDSQVVSFGTHTHGYAVGTNPLGPTLTSSVNDQAIYYQRITTIVQNNLTVTQSAPGVGDLTVGLAQLSPTAVEGWTLLSGNTLLGAGTGPFLGLWPDSLTWSIFSYAYFPGNPFHFRTADPGLFPNAPFTAPPGILSSLTGLTVDFAVFMVNAAGAYDSRSNMVRYTFQ